MLSIQQKKPKPSNKKDQTSKPNKTIHNLTSYLSKWLWMLQRETSRLKCVLPVLGQMVSVPPENVLVTPQINHC